MAIATLLQVSDMHAKSGLKEFECVRDLANSIDDLDAVFLAGDLYDGWEQSKIMEKAIQKMQEKAAKILSEEEKAYLQNEENKNKIEVYNLVQKFGGIEKFKQLELDSEKEDEKKKIIQIYESNKDMLEPLMNKIGEISVDSSELEQKIQDQITGGNNIIGEINSPVYGTRGNHDTDEIYTMDKIHFLEKKGSVKIKGLNIAGIPNTNEKLPSFPQELYSELEQDDFVKSIEDFVKQFGTEEDLQKYYETNPVYQRLKDEEIDILVMHKGLDEFAANYGFGAGAATIAQEKQPSIIMSGHVHDGFYAIEDEQGNAFGYEGVRTAPNYACVSFIDTETKEIEQLDLYKRIAA